MVWRSPIMIPCLLFSGPIASVFGLDEETTAQAADYIFYLSLFNVAFAVNMVLGASLRAAGDTRTPLWIAAIANVVNVVLVYWFVFGGLGLPPLGVAGAGAANGASFAFGAVILLALWSTRRLKVGIGGPSSLSRKRFRQLIHIGYPAAIEQVVLQIGFIAFLWLVAF
ncbi:MAG: MATE family efflux transporter [Gammaproteobacteria bacterium]|nr:MATE family efflux transporter [Gammaproteobacteria bacterium]